MRKPLMIGLCGIGSLLAACGSVEKDETKEAEATSLIGSWTLPCATDSAYLSLKGSQIYTATEVTKTLEVYADGKCGKLVDTTVTKSTYSDGGDAGAADAKKIDFTLVTVTETPATTDEAEIRNSNNGRCGHKDWAAGVATDVTGPDCAGDEDRVTGAVNYHIYKISGTSLNFGRIDDTHSGKNSDQRPVTLETSITLTKS